MQWSVWGLVGILSALGWIIGLAVQGVITPQVAGVFLILVVALKAIGRGAGGSIGRIVHLGFNVGLPVASVMTLSILLTGGSLNDMGKVLGGVLVLLTMLYGFYLMISGAFAPRNRR